jgi:hypothetical protein
VEEMMMISSSSSTCSGFGHKYEENEGKKEGGGA